MDEQEQEHILGIYGSISMITGKMLSAARTGDWDRLVALEHDCRALIETLKRSDAGARAGRHFAQRKIAFIHKILADDAEIRKLTEPWMTRMEAYLGSVNREHRLQKAYGTDHRD